MCLKFWKIQTFSHFKWKTIIFTIILYLKNDLLHLVLKINSSKKKVSQSADSLARSCDWCGHVTRRRWSPAATMSCSAALVSLFVSAVFVRDGEFREPDRTPSGILLPPSPRSPFIPDLFCSRFRKSADCQTKAALVSVGLRTAHARAKALTCPQGSARPRQRPKRRGTMWRCGTGPTCSGGCITLTLGTRSFRWSCGCRWVSASPLCAWSSLSGSEADVSRNDLSLSVLMCTFRRKFKLKEMKTGRIVQVLRSAEETCDDDQMTHSSVVCYRRGKLIIFTTSDTCQTSPKASL